jgi:hypothetical protein
MKKRWWFVVGIGVLAIAGFALLRRGSDSDDISGCAS